MRRYTYIRWQCLLLALLALLGAFAACAPTPQPPQSSKRLQITEEKIGYSAAFASDYATRLLDPLCRVIYLSGGLQLTEAERGALYDRLRGYFLPAAARSSITQAELELLLAETQLLCGALEGAAYDRLVAFCNFYQRTVAMLGTSRAGALLQEGAAFYLNEQITVCEMRYSEYGYEYLRQDAEKYRTRLARMRAELNAEAFTNAAGVFLLFGSFATGILPDRDTAALLSDGDILLVLRMQAGKFANNGVTEEQWHLFIELLCDCRSKTPDTAREAIFASMQQTGDVAKTATCMPALLDLYAAAAATLTPADIKILRDEAREGEWAGVICRALTQNGAALAAVLDAFERAAAAYDEAEHARAIGALGKTADFAAFLQQTAIIDRAALTAQLAACAAGEQIDLQAAVRAYLCGKAPYLAYAIFCEE